MPLAVFPPDVHFASDLSSEQLAPGLRTLAGQILAPFCHLKAPPSSEYDLVISMKHIKSKSPVTALNVCDSSLHCPYSSPNESCIQSARPPVQHGPIDAVRSYTEAATSSTSPCLLPHVCVDPYMASKPGLSTGWEMFLSKLCYLNRIIRIFVNSWKIKWSDLIPTSLKKFHSIQFSLIYQWTLSQRGFTEIYTFRI